MKPWQIVLLAGGCGCSVLTLVLGILVVAGVFWFGRASATQQAAADARAMAQQRGMVSTVEPTYQARVPAGDSPSVADWLKANELERLVPGCPPLVRPAVRLTSRAATADLALGQSRLGGEPDLPADFLWPAWQKQPLAFLAQINLGEVPAAARATLGLPDAGWLLFFENADQGETAPGSFQVAYVPATANLVRRALPTDRSEDTGYTGCTVTFGTREELPDGGEEVLNALGLSDDESERYQAVRARLGEPEPIHKLGGHPDLIQGSMTAECRTAGGPGDWVLLAQFDSDDAANMMWGDAGRLYYWIHRADLAAAKFDRVWRTCQCY